MSYYNNEDISYKDVLIIWSRWLNREQRDRMSRYIGARSRTFYFISGLWSCKVVSSRLRRRDLLIITLGLEIVIDIFVWVLSLKRHQIITLRKIETNGAFVLHHPIKDSNRGEFWFLEKIVIFFKMFDVFNPSSTDFEIITTRPAVCDCFFT